MNLAAHAFVMREVQGRLGEIGAAVQQFADDQPAMPVWRCGLLSRASPDRPRARSCDASTSASPPTASPRCRATTSGCRRWPCWPRSAPTSATSDGARELRALLEPYSGRNVVTPGVAYLGPVDRYLGLLATGPAITIRPRPGSPPRATWPARWAPGPPAPGSRSTRPRRCASATPRARPCWPRRRRRRRTSWGWSGWPSGPGRWGRRNRRQRSRRGAEPAAARGLRRRATPGRSPAAPRRST